MVVRISPKTMVLASKKGIGIDIVKRFRDIGINTKYVLTAKDLGVGRVLGERRSTAILSKRITHTKGRIYRIKIFFLFGKVLGWRWPAGWLAWKLARLAGLAGRLAGAGQFPGQAGWAGRQAGWSWQADLDVGPDL